MDPAVAGGNFVDHTLGVVVDNEADTLIVFMPEFLHGTTVSRPGVDRAAVAFPFSKHIGDAWRRAQQIIDRGELIEIEKDSPNAQGNIEI